MSCYNPMLAVPSELTSEGKYRYKILGRYEPIALELDPRSLKIPCGKCLGCRLDYSRQWADRMMLELERTKKAVFITLTYNEENVPRVFDDDQYYGLTLDKRDCQLFMKSLRKKFSDRELRFYAAGEYGSHTRRPHLHLIVFGLSLEDFTDRRRKEMNELGQWYWISDELAEKIWKKGFGLLTEVSWRTCAYVSRYVMKKAAQSDLEWFQLPEFSLMSRRPGLGAYYLEDNPDIFDYSSIYLSSKEGSVKVSIPKYFLGKLKLTDEKRYNEIMEEKKQFASDRDLLMMQKTDLSYVQFLEIEQEKLYDKTKILSKLRL